MAGIWDPMDKPSLPGWYNRFQIIAEETIRQGKRGVLAMPVKSDWGPVKTPVTISNITALKDTFGMNEDFTAFRLGYLCLLGSPKELLLYRITDGSEACGTLTLKDTTTATAVSVIDINTKYPTDREFSITVRTSLKDETKKDLLVFEGNKLRQTFESLPNNVDEIVNIINKANGYVLAVKKASGNGKLADISNTKLAGGSNGVEAITNEEYVEALAAFEKAKFNRIALDGINDAALIEMLKTWIDDQRKQGRKITGYVGYADDLSNDEINQKSKTLNFEGIVNVNIKGLKNDIRYTRAECACYIAGLASGMRLQDSLCNRLTIFEDVEALTTGELNDALDAGTLVCYKDDDNEILILDDLNTLSQNSEKGEYLRYIRTVDFIDVVDTDTCLNSKKYIGKTPNDTNGQTAVLMALKKYFEVFATERIIEPDFTVEVDEALQASASKNEFFWKWNAEHIDVMKRIYGTGYIK